MREGRTLVAALPVSTRGPERVAFVRDVYVDTEGHDLLRAGYALRTRATDGGEPEVTLKSIGGGSDGVCLREERTSPFVGPLRDARHLPSGGLRRAVLAITRDRPLVPLARVVGPRIRRRLRVDAELVLESSVDRVTLAAGGRKAALTELELELVQGDPAAFRAFVERARAGRTTRAVGSKFERTLALARIAVPSAVRIAAARLSREDVGPSTPSARAGARDLAHLAAELERSIEAARRGAVEGVHDLRTIARRLRAVLGLHAPDVDAAVADDLRARLRSLRRAAGDLRDLDTLAAALRGASLDPALEPGRAGLLARLRRARPALRRAFTARLRSARLEALAARLAVPVSELARRSSLPFEITAALRLPRSIEPALAARRAIDGALEDASPARVHALRVAAKRARYAVEACLPALGRPARRFARRLRAFLDGAGAMRDAEVHAQRTRTLSRDVGTDAGERDALERAAAALSATLDRRAARARRRLDALAEDALGPESIRELLDHLARRAARTR